MAAGMLAGQVALVTGTGGGLGQAIALALANAGARAAITEMPDRLPLAEQTAAQMRAAGGEALALPLDVTDLTTIQAAVDGAAEAFGGRIDVLVNNAGINVRQPAFDVTEDAWDSVLAVNLKGLFFTAQRVGRRMRDQRPAGGCIINVASIMGLIGYRDRAAYCASKGGVVNLSRALAFEWAAHDIRVNALCPTFVRTPLTAPLLDDPVAGGDILRRTPLGRLATPEDVAAAALYLASPGARMVTGQALTVDGGWLAV
ncbi:MAG: SDR family oxidoreductase [Thermomicrobiales bacterium]|nr:SDR family oxidoreductase [Thermomicrobiales bacterium]